MARILVIDDEPTILSLLATILKKDGHEVTAVESADRALELNLSRFDLILCDVMMPGTDGFAFVSVVRDRLDCPIVFLTAKSEENDAVTGLSVGADDYLRKPFGAAELRAKGSAPGQVFSKAQILQSVAGWDARSDASTVAVHIGNARSKLKDAGVSPIETVWGIGYKWIG